MKAEGCLSQILGKVEGPCETHHRVNTASNRVENSSIVGDTEVI